MSKYARELCKLAHKELVDHPEQFELFLSGTVCIGPNFTVRLEPFYNSAPQLAVRKEGDYTREQIRDGNSEIVIEMPFPWKRRIVKAALSVVDRAALKELKTKLQQRYDEEAE